MYNEYPEFLPKKEAQKRDIIVAQNHLTLEEKPWCTIPKAMSAIDDLREKEDEINLDRLEEIDTYIQELSKIFESRVKE